ncbi:snare-complex protein syntaxin-18 N-terminus-domain-containing protein [Gigaspora rosea]|uniref:Snare-complex protein syntaxin-18 N-terminus-domain-containing protein n=1 Tax=Gigaspora rosea TaxID=44941 RepID=A0A397U0N0_9GLOM|nr:snare-complex protein syntaxin-18 N-terminus-domain-containing protein [Gigaspora rosea]
MVDITPDFRKLVNEISTTSSTNNGTKKRIDVLPPVKKNVRDVQDEFLKEAYRIASHINNLKTFLLSIRKAYLNISRQNSSNNRYSSSPAFLIKENLDQGLSPRIDPSITTLTDKQRDEIDLHTKTIIQQCHNRIKELEDAEQRKYYKIHTIISCLIKFFIYIILLVRQNSIANNTWTNILLTVFSSDERDVLAAIRSSITWLLNKRLTEVSKIQKDQQETRIMKEIEKRESTLYKPTESKSPSRPSSAIQTMLNEESETPMKSDNEMSGNIEGDDDIEQHLSAEQKMILERENESMMKELATTLEQVNQAEKALLEISTLQSVLSNHLAVQTQQTDRLYAEAIAITDRVQEGNLMLTKARQRASDTRKWILVFLILASFVLLFLDWYD